ncbi:hypothetical protein QQF64_000265 [Cirrhinus molitorella]|uniref:Gamma-glutamyltranspeptidase 1 n=1 Tax=Cirrhinus molitorella TaxID=172907 RepID=A0ABR3NWP3_9TELE
MGHGKNNLIKPGKRPLSSMCPTIILDKHSKQVKMVVGGAGGTNITTSVAQVILNYLFFDYDLQKAVEEPRVQITINETNIEKGFDKAVINGLKPACGRVELEQAPKSNTEERRIRRSENKTHPVYLNTVDCILCVYQIKDLNQEKEEGNTTPK